MTTNSTAYNSQWTEISQIPKEYASLIKGLKPGERMTMAERVDIRIFDIFAQNARDMFGNHYKIQEIEPVFGRGFGVCLTLHEQKPIESLAIERSYEQILSKMTKGWEDATLDPRKKVEEGSAHLIKLRSLNHEIPLIQSIARKLGIEEDVRCFLDKEDQIHLVIQEKKLGHVMTKLGLELKDLDHPQSLVFDLSRREVDFASPDSLKKGKVEAQKLDQATQAAFDLDDQMESS